MKLAVHPLKSIRLFSAVAKKCSVTSESLTSEFFEHIRHQVYGDSKVLDKIVVEIVKNSDTKVPVLINRNVSTGAHSLNHISKQFADNAVLLEVFPSVGSSYFSSVNQPIQDKAEIRKIGFENSEFTEIINETYWRSCSLLTGSILKNALNLDISIKINDNNISDSFFSVNVSGITSPLSIEEINAINRFGKKFLASNVCLESLYIPSSIAEENGLSENNLVRIGTNVFATSGPVINNTKQVGRFSIFQSKPNDSAVTVAGVSLPSPQPTSSYSWGLIVKNAIQKFQKY